MNVNKPRRVILWGGFAPLHDYMSLLREAQIDVACLVDPLDQQTGGGVVPVRSVAGFCQDRDLYHGLPIVVLEDRGAAAADPLWQAARSLTDELHVENPLLDPVFLADHLELKFPGRALAGGFPGSGNGVVQAVAERLLPATPAPLAGKEHLISFLAGQRHERMHRRLERCFTDLGWRYHGMSHQQQNRVNWFAGGPGNAAFVMYNLPDRAHLLSTIHKTHETLRTDLIQRYSSLGYRLLVAMRHPLDILISLAAKLRKPPSSVLADFEWFHKMALALRDYCAAALDAGTQVELVHYERLITDPLATIREIAAALGVECTLHQASDIWEAVGFRPLHFIPGHLWQPGIGKWRKYLSQSHLQVVYDIGLDLIAAELGYHDIAFDAVGIQAQDSAPAADEPTEPQAVADQTYSGIYRLPSTFINPRVLYETDDSGIGWISNHAPYTRQYQELIGSTAMRRYLLSLQSPAPAARVQRRAA